MTVDHSVLSNPARVPAARRRPTSSSATLLQMYRSSQGGPSAVLHWLAVTTGGWAGVVDSRERVLCAHPPRPTDRLPPNNHAEALHRSDRALRAPLAPTGPLTRSGTTPPPRHSLLLLPAPDRRHEAAALLFEAAALVARCLRAEEVERARVRALVAEHRSREVVLNLLLSGTTTPASQVADALGETLPDPVRVVVVDGNTDQQHRVTVRYQNASPSPVWTTTDPGHTHHLVLLVPGDTQPPTTNKSAMPDTADARTPDARPSLEATVGVSGLVALRDTHTGYQQALSALAVARNTSGRYAEHTATPDLPTLLGLAGEIWANQFMRPLLDHEPDDRRGIPTEYLVATARSWLEHPGGAAGDLWVHRNTLRLRLRRIEELLGLDLSTLRDCATLWLALRLHTRRRHLDDGPSTVDDLLSLPGLRQWAHQQTAALRDGGRHGEHDHTLRTWLECDGRLSSTAQRLGLSVPGVRNRLGRLERLLDRPLLHAQDTRYQLWLAVRSVDLTAEEASAAAAELALLER